MSELSYNPANIRAMIVDDHDPIRKAMKRILSHMGIKNIIECFDGTDAIKESNKLPIDIILLDLYMRKVNGFKVLSSIRNRAIGADIPIIIVTGEATKENIVKASDLGADDYIIKPFQAEAIETKVHQVLNKFFSPPPLLKTLRHGDRLLISKDHEKALEAYHTAVEIDSNSMRAKHSLAVALDLCGKTEEAINQLQRNIEISPSYYKNFQTIANIYLRSGEEQKCIEALGKELELNPKQASRQIQLARLLLKQGDPVGAISHFKEALKEESKDKSALLGIGQAFANMDDLEKAIYYFKRLRRHHPKETKALQAIIKYCLDGGQPKIAEIALKDEKNMHPDRLDVYVQLSNFYSSQNRTEEANQTITELLKIAPENNEALKAKANLEFKKKNYQEALSIFDKLSTTEPTLEIYLLQAKCLLPLGQLKDCIHILHKALLLDPSHAGAMFMLATAYKKSKQYSKAYLCYMKAYSNGWPKNKCLQEIQGCITKVKSRRSEVSYKLTS